MVGEYERLPADSGEISMDSGGCRSICSGGDREQALGVASAPHRIDLVSSRSRLAPASRCSLRILPHRL
uniref:Uncharacterized protein n=1 Tax=Leersia perrieri TaxID=77586 RepID=A0A0D9XDA5_9ORYZ